MYAVVLLEPAKDDLLEIGRYIALDNLERAITFIDELEDSYANTLSQFPRAGVQYPAAKGVRQLSKSGYTAFYEIDDEAQEVFILRILDLTKPLAIRGITF